MTAVNRGDLKVCIRKCWAYGRLYQPDEIDAIPGESKHFVELPQPDLDLEFTTVRQDDAQLISTSDEKVGYEVHRDLPRTLLYRTGVDRRDYFRVDLKSEKSATIEVVSEAEAIGMYQEMPRKVTPPKGLQNAAMS